MGRGKARRKYTKEFDLETVTPCRQPGMSVARVTADPGVPANSLYHWNQELVAHNSHFTKHRPSARRSAIR
ncbi:MAG: transposase [Phycisphaerae bacterium]|nr:transposase [Phycisphaerae bacterium]